MGNLTALCDSWYARYSVTFGTHEQALVAVCSSFFFALAALKYITALKMPKKVIKMVTMACMSENRFFCKKKPDKQNRFSSAEIRKNI